MNEYYLYAGIFCVFSALVTFGWLTFDIYKNSLLDGPEILLRDGIKEIFRVAA